MTEFHKIWIDQCEAAEGIRQRFGVQDAAHYLIGEKFLRFLQASQDSAEFTRELPEFVARIRSIFEPRDLAHFFTELEAGRVPDPVKLFNGCEAEEKELDESEVLYDAEKILLIENAKKLLL